MALLKVLLLLGLGVSVNSDVSLQKRIIGGKKCDDKERLYHVRITADGVFRCGGSLIHRQWILTAAHCRKPGRIMAAEIGVHPGKNKIKQIIIDPPVVYIDKDGQEHDIMLLKLQTEVKYIAPVPPPRCKNRLKLGDSVQLAGEGPTITGPNCKRDPKAPYSLDLQCVNMKLDDCPDYVQKYNKHESRFCVKEKDKDVSRGDSGGGVIFNRKIYGVISTSGEEYACDQPVLMMDVCEYMNWINQITDIK